MQLRKLLVGLAMAAFFGASASRVLAAGDVVFADFEGSDYGAWKAEGTAFGSAPAPGTLPNQMNVDGFRGRGLVNSFYGGDGAKGRLISPKFRIERHYIAFLIGGGGWKNQTCLNLLVDGKVVRTSSGINTKSSGSERLTPRGWDVSELRGFTAQLEIVDAATGGWGHINVDEIVFTDTKPQLDAEMIADASRRIVANKKWIFLPVKNGATPRTLTVGVGGKTVRRFDIELADNAPDWWAPLDISAWRGQTLEISANQLHQDSRGLTQIAQGDTIPGAESLYREPLRAQFHFSARRGWNNDPNGLAFYNGEYHLFFQHNPYGWSWGNMTWGHATSRDLVHWKEHGDVLHPDELGPMFSGSAVVDWNNSSGFGKNGKPPLVLIYTAAGDPPVQCIAWSNDGRTFTKYAGNPVVKKIAQGDRDPKVMWHAPTQRWVMALYVEKEKRHTVHFLSSPNLRDWKLESVTEGESATEGMFLFECPDLFALPVDGDAKNQKWVLTGANGEYAIGSFDGKKFTPETKKLPGHRGAGFYAAQTYSDEPKNRRIQIDWFQTATPGMPFNQSLSIPMELKLISTPEGPRLTHTPIPELQSLRAKTHTFDVFTLRENDVNRLASTRGELLEIRAEFAPENDAQTTFLVRGVPILFDARTQEITVNGHKAPAPLRNGKQRLTIFADRTGLEVFAGDGLTFLPMPINLNPNDTSLAVAVQGGTAMFSRLDVHELKSAWQTPSAK